MARSREYSQNEERANTWSHALGILFGLIAGYILLAMAIDSGDGWAVGSVAVYLFGMLSCYTISTSYHACANGAKKDFLQKLDHASIYVHIAGTYTPFTLVVLRQQGAWGWALFSFVWLAALIGIAATFRKQNKHSHLETICYVLMGASIFVALKPLIDVLSANNQLIALYWILAGGASYIIGALFYSWAKKAYMHTVFHFFVLGGSVCHVMAVYYIL